MAILLFVHLTRHSSTASEQLSCFSGANTTCVYRVSVLIDYVTEPPNAIAVFNSGGLSVSFVGRGGESAVNAQRYERSDARGDTRAGHYERNLQTKAGEVRLKVPKLRQQTSRRPLLSATGGARAQSKRR
jgi:Transposase, Mutator family